MWAIAQEQNTVAPEVRRQIEAGRVLTDVRRGFICWNDSCGLGMGYTKRTTNYQGHTTM